MKRSSVGKSKERAGGVDIGLDHHQAPTAVEHPKRERTLRPRHLVMIKFHRVHSSAAVLVVLAVRPGGFVRALFPIYDNRVGRFGWAVEKRSRLAELQGGNGQVSLKVL